MKKQEISFLGYDALAKRSNSKVFKTFDWDKCAEIIREKLKEFPNLVAETGLQRDWDYTGGVIFKDSKPVSKTYTYLSSNWAIPTLIISNDGEELEEIECFTEDVNTRFDSGSKWDAESLAILAKT